MNTATPFVLERDSVRRSVNLRDPPEPIWDGGNTEGVTDGDLTIWAQLERGFDALSGKWIGLNRCSVSEVKVGADQIGRASCRERVCSTV